jgi:hypothetical protein
MKKVVYGLLILGALVGGLFALFEDKIFVDVPEDVMQNLEDRYGGTFKFIDYIPEENTENSRVMKIKAKEGEFKLTRYYDANGVVHYNDNYLGYKYFNTIKEELDGVFSLPLSEGTLEYEVDLDGSSFPDDTDKLLFLPQLLAKDGTFIKLNIVTTFEWDDNNLKTLATYLDSGLGMKVVVSALEHDELIDMRDFDSMMRSSETEGKRVFFSIGKDKEILYTNRE